jgi:signal transducing adaptor molecule
MFKAGQPNPYDDIVSKYQVIVLAIFNINIDHDYADKTTDENLTGENWELILNLCDKVQDEGEQGCVRSLSISFIKLLNIL